MLKVGRIMVFSIAGLMLLVAGLVFLMLLGRQEPSSIADGGNTLLWLEALGMPALAIIGAVLTYRLAKVGALIVLMAGAGLTALAIFGGFEVKYLNAAFGVMFALVGAMMVFSKQP